MSRKEVTVVRPSVAYLLLVATMAAWASALVVARGVHTIFPPMQLSFGRWLIAGSVLAVLSRRALRSDAPQILEAWKQFLSLGLFLVGASAATMLSVNYTTAINATLVNAAQPTVTVLMAWLMLHERLSRMQVAGVVAAIIGIILMILRLDLQVLLSLRFNSGDLIMVGAVFGYALYATLLPKLPRTIDRGAGLCVILLAGSLLLAPFALIEALFFRTARPGMDAVAVLVYLATIPSLMAMYFWNTAIQSIGVNRSAIYVNLTPVFGAAFAMLFLGESLYMYHLIGTAFICLGIVLVMRGHHRAHQTPAPADQASADSGVN